jgi:hypothetical protein
MNFATEALEERGLAREIANILALYRPGKETLVAIRESPLQVQRDILLVLYVLEVARAEGQRRNSGCLTRPH